MLVVSEIRGDVKMSSCTTFCERCMEACIYIYEHTKLSISPKIKLDLL